MVLDEGLFKISLLMGVVETSSGLRYSYRITTTVTTTVALDIALHDLILRKQNIHFLPLREDNTYGSAWRSDNVRFAFADIEANVDGSITVMDGQFPHSQRGGRVPNRFGSLTW